MQGTTTMENIQGQLEKFDNFFSEKEQGENGAPTARKLEEMWGDMLNGIKEICAEHISERLSNISEKTMVSRKKTSI